MSRTINHIGIVTEVTDTELVVSMNQQSACDGCRAKSYCHSTESGNQMMHFNHPGGEFKVGDKVLVELRQSQATWAVVIAYIVPIILVLILLFCGNGKLSDEKLGLISLLIIMVYFFILFIFRKKIETNFNFKINKV